MAFIPARQNSKRLPRKNLRNLCGKPLIFWTIQAAINSSFDIKVHVSTDSEEIRKVSLACGAEAPFLRSSANSTDFSHPIDAFKETVEFYKVKGELFDYVILLQPTSPLRTTRDIDNALAYLLSCEPSDTVSVISVSETAVPKHWMFELDHDGSASQFVFSMKKHLSIRSQDSKRQFYVNGSIYAAKVSDVLSFNSFYIPEGRTEPLIIPRQRSIDIDTYDDLKLAEYFMTAP